MSLHVCPGEIFILDSRLAIFWGKKLSFWPTACFVLIVVSLLSSFPMVSWTEGVR